MTEEHREEHSQVGETLEASVKTPSYVGPVTAPERNQAVDVLRGFAVLGILGMNIYAFSMPFSAYFNPLLYGGDKGANIWTWIFTHFFFDQKFYTIFSMLFGAGVILMTTRAAEKGVVKFGKVYYKRILWLLLFGLLHGYLLWSGDILYTYAVCGLALYPLRRVSPKVLIPVGAVAMLLPLLLMFAYSFQLDFMQTEVKRVEEMRREGQEPSNRQRDMLAGWEQTLEFQRPTPEELERQVKIHQNGYWGIVQFRAPMLLMSQIMSTIFFLFWRIGGIMLIGMGLMKLGVFTAERSARFYWWLVLLGYGIGLPLVALSAYDQFSHGFDLIHQYRIAGSWNYIGAPLVALGHVGVVMLICKSGILDKVGSLLSAVGRMAFTNYIMQSVICTFIFYGYGLGLYGKIPRLYQMAFVIGVWALQILYSPIWLRYYRFGPMEWVWRSLTYGKLQPMRRVPENQV